MIEARVTARLVRYQQVRAKTIHDDDTANDFGFAGALVPGVDTMSWLMDPLCELWGTAWVERGTIELKNIRPVYDGQEVVLRVVPNGAEATLQVLSEDGNPAAVGSATLPDRPTEIDPADYPFRPLPEPRLRAKPGLLAEGDRLGGEAVPTDAEFMAQLRKRSLARHPALTGDILHPLAFQQISTWQSMKSLEQDGPGVHAWGETINLATVPAGSVLASAGFVKSLWERKGNHYMQTEQLVTADGKPAALVRRNVIYSLVKAAG